MIRIGDWRRSHMLLADAIIVAVPIVGAVAFAWWSGRLSECVGFLDDSRGAVYSATASIAGSLLGFVITAVSIIAAFGAMPRFDLLKKADQLEPIFHIFFDAIYWLAGATALSLVSLIFDTERMPRAALTVASLLVFSITTARVWRCVWILQRMSKIMARPIPETQPQEGHD